MRSAALLIILSMVLPDLPLEAQEKTAKISVFHDSTDHALDISNWLIDMKGALVIPTLITEPAVGYGLAAAAVFFHSSYSEKKGPPSMSGMLGGCTQNGTWMAGVFHIGYWKQDRLRYMGALARTNANLSFYGAGYTSILESEPVNLNMDAWLFLQQLKGRIGVSRFFMGGRYLLLSTDNTFEVPIDNPEFSGKEISSTLSEATLIINYDSRNNVFSALNGFYVDLSGTYSDTWFGGDALYARVALEALGYFPATSRLMVGLRYSSNYTFGDVPFYARPMIRMRGVPLMKYQNRNTLLMETEVSYAFAKRWNVLGFAGIGTAYKSVSDFDKGRSVRTLGTGFRYLLARKLGAKMGVDFAASQDDFAFYIIFGSAWLR
jgi:hypothetical protein